MLINLDDILLKFRNFFLNNTWYLLLGAKSEYCPTTTAN